MAVYRWRLTDPYDFNRETRTYVFPQNPAEMSSPFAARAVTSTPTTYGNTLLREGARPPAEWTFGGTIRDRDHYEDLRKWVYERSNRVTVTDHFGRKLTTVLTNFDPTPRRAYGKYWMHSYNISALVLAITTPTVGELGL
jgi:hypothetical protein